MTSVGSGHRLESVLRRRPDTLWRMEGVEGLLLKSRKGQTRPGQWGQWARFQETLRGREGRGRRGAGVGSDVSCLGHWQMVVTFEEMGRRGMQIWGQGEIAASVGSTRPWVNK